MNYYDASGLDLPTKNKREGTNFKNFNVGEKVDCSADEHGRFIANIVKLYQNSAIVENDSILTVVRYKRMWRVYE